LLAAGLRPAFDSAVLPEYLATAYVSGEDTFFSGVRRLLPGHTLTWSVASGFRSRRYWQMPPPAEGGSATLDDHALAVGDGLSRAVRSHLMSDVPLGLFLSGGIDSSALLAVMAPMVKEPVRTFSVGFSEREANELAYARIAARAAGAEHREVVVTPEEFFRALPRLVWHEDEPIAFPSSVPLYFVSELARRHVKVVLTGEGADELFLGYNRYRVTSWNERLGRPYWALAPHALQATVGRLAARLPRKLRRYAQRSFLALPPGPRGLFCENFSVFPRALRGQVLAAAGQAEDRDPYANVLRCYHEADGGALDRMSRADLQTFLVRLLAKQDQMSMAASIESRVPFLDHEFVEHALAIPGRFKLRGWQTKAVLRRALRGRVDPRILSRRKMGFPVPVGRWLRGSFWPLVEEFVLGPRAAARGHFDPLALRALAEEHRQGIADHGTRLWLLVNLEIWHRVFVDGEDAAAVMRAA
jgi:asparagine synthase (glutamine-hydrolysing)